MYRRSIRSCIFAAGLTSFAVLASIATPAAAQLEERGVPSSIVGSGIELRPFVGALIPTGDHRDVLKNAVLAGLQLGWSFHPNFAVIGSFGWSPSEDKANAGAPTAGGETVDVFQYDIGVEGRLPLAVGTAWSVTPYLGIGGGGRTYHYRDVDDASAETNALGYGALGVDVGPTSGRYALRIEARDNITAFKGLQGELDERKTRNDVQLAGGLTWRF